MPDKKNEAATKAAAVDPAAAAPRPRGKNVHIAADEVEVTTTLEVPEGHVVVEPPTAATPAITMPETDARAAEVAAETEAALKAKAAREETILRTEGQRAVSALWENTQMRLALLTVAGFMLAHVFVVVAIGYVLLSNWRLLTDAPAALAALVAILTGSLGAIASMASLVIAAYFHRTNSTRVGGVSKDYEGR